MDEDQDTRKGGRRGYTKAPNERFTWDVSLAAAEVHTRLSHVAWAHGRVDENDLVELPELGELARLVGCARSTLAKHLGELRAAGLVETVRPSRRAPLRYRVLDSRCAAASSPTLGRLSSPTSRARVKAEQQDQDQRQEASTVARRRETRHARPVDVDDAIERLVADLDDADAFTAATFRRHFGHLDAALFDEALSVVEKHRGELDSEAAYAFRVLAHAAAGYSGLPSAPRWVAP